MSSCLRIARTLLAGWALLAVAGFFPGRTAQAEVFQTRHYRKLKSVGTDLSDDNGPNEPNLVPGRFLVTLRGGSNRVGTRSTSSIRSRANSIINKLRDEKMSAEIIHTYSKAMLGFSLQADDVNKALEILDGEYEVLSIFPVVSLPAPDVSAIEVNASDLRGSYFASNSSAPTSTAWSRLEAAGLGELDGTGVRVGIIDSGVDYTHPALAGKVVTAFDFVGNAYRPNPSSGRADPLDCMGHGTHVAGIIAGAWSPNTAATSGPSNGFRFTGVAPGVRLGVYKVFGCSGGAASDTVVAAMDRAVTDGMQIVHLSIGDEPSWKGPVADAAHRLSAMGIVVVAAMGNAGSAGLFMGTSVANAAPVVSVASVQSYGAPAAVKMRVSSSSAAAARYDVRAAYGNVTLLASAVVKPSAAALDAGVAAVASGADGCGPELRQLGDLTRSVALLSVGGCSVSRKVANAVASGAIGVILYGDDAAVEEVRRTVLSTSPGAWPAPDSPFPTAVLVVDQSTGRALYDAYKLASSISPPPPSSPPPDLSTPPSPPSPPLLSSPPSPPEPPRPPPSPPAPPSPPPSPQSPPPPPPPPQPPRPPPLPPPNRLSPAAASLTAPPSRVLPPPPARSPNPGTGANAGTPGAGANPGTSSNPGSRQGTSETESPPPPSSGTKDVKQVGSPTLSPPSVASPSTQTTDSQSPSPEALDQPPAQEMSSSSGSTQTVLGVKDGGSRRHLAESRDTGLDRNSRLSVARSAGMRSGGANMRRRMQQQRLPASSPQILFPTIVDVSGTLISPFSSWGPNPVLRLKPTVSAPGGAILSTVPFRNSTSSGFAYLSGTSQAAPYVTGALALSLSSPRPPKDITTLMNSLISTARPVRDVSDTAAPQPTLPVASVFRAGSGVIDIGALVTNQVDFNVTKVELGTTLRFGSRVTVFFEAFSRSNTPLTFQVFHAGSVSINASSLVSIDPTPYGNNSRRTLPYDGPYLPPAVELGWSNSRIPNMTSFTIASGGNTRFRVTFSLASWVGPTDQLFYSGYLGFMSSSLFSSIDQAATGSPALHPPLYLPYMGYTANLSDLSVLLTDQATGAISDPNGVWMWDDLPGAFKVLYEDGDDDYDRGSSKGSDDGYEKAHDYESSAYGVPGPKPPPPPPVRLTYSLLGQRASLPSLAFFLQRQPAAVEMQLHSTTPNYKGDTQIGTVVAWTVTGIRRPVTGVPFVITWRGVYTNLALGRDVMVTRGDYYFKVRFIRTVAPGDEEGKVVDEWTSPAFKIS